MKVLIDLDGVLVDFVGGVCDKFKQANPYDKADNNGVFDIVSLLGIDASSFWSSLDYDFWVNLKKLEHADALMDYLLDVIGLSNLCILSSPCNTHGCAEGKIDWIKYNYPMFKRRFLLGSQKEFCASSNSLLIDDYDYNIQVFKEAGGNAILVPQLWNSDFSLPTLSTTIERVRKLICQSNY